MRRADEEDLPGATTADVVAVLNNGSGVMTRVEHAGLVMVEIGANDVAHSTACGTNVACYEPKLPSIENNLDTIVARIHTLARGDHVTIVMLDYWSVWLGGNEARAQAPAYVEAANDVTAEVDNIIRHDGDEMPLLAPDGEHPNAEGHERIADAVEHAIRTT